MVSAVIAALGLAGCYGSTEPATDINTDSAVLHGQGTTNNGPAHVFFKVWPTDFPNRWTSLSGKNLPGGVSGPYKESTTFNDQVRVLAPDTSYSFQLCGTDGGASESVCAQTRTFKTTHPTADVVSGWAFNGVPNSVDVISASSDPSGTSPGGTMTLGRFSGRVTCVQVQGHLAAVGAVGTNSPPGEPATELFQIVDGGAGAVDQIGSDATVGSTTPPDCSSATFANLTRVPNSYIYVWDAATAPTGSH